MKRGTPDHPKMHALAAELVQFFRDQGRELSHKHCLLLAVGILEKLWQWCSRYAPQGDVGKYPPAAIADAIGWEHDPEALFSMGVKLRWFDRLARGILFIHDWHEHCEDAVDKWLRDNALYYANGKPTRRTPMRTRKSRDKICPPGPEPKPEPKPKPLPLPDGEPAAAAAALVELGAEAAAAHRAVDAALRVNCTCEQIYAIIEYWKKNRHWGVGALVNRVWFATPRSDVDKGWPEALKDRRAESDAAWKRQAEARERQKKEDAEAAERAKALEAAFGQRLDALTDEEVSGLVAGEAFVADRLRRSGRSSPIVREWLMKKLEQLNHG